MPFTNQHNRIMNRLQAGAKLTLFVHENKLRSLKTHDTDARKLEGTKGAVLIGCYDKNCQPDWLLDDLIWAGAKYVS